MRTGVNALLDSNVIASVVTGLSGVATTWLIIRDRKRNRDQDRQQPPSPE